MSRNDDLIERERIELDHIERLRKQREDAEAHEGILEEWTEEVAMKNAEAIAATDNIEAIAAAVARKIRPSNITLSVIGVLLAVIGFFASNTLISIQTDLRAHGETLTDVPVISASVKRIETTLTGLASDVTEIRVDVATLKAGGNKTASLSTLRR